MVPFLNARIQGLYRTGTALAGKEADQKKAIARMAMLSGVSAAIWALSSGDDRWDDEPLYRKMNYHILYAGDYRILIPKAFEVGVLAQTLPEVALDVISGQEGGKYVADAAAHTFSTPSRSTQSRRSFAQPLRFTLTTTSSVAGRLRAVAFRTCQRVNVLTPPHRLCCKALAL